MTENLEIAPRGVSRKQLWTVGVLALIFAGVLIAQFGTASATPVPHSALAETQGNSGRPTAASATSGQPAAESHRKATQPIQPWPSCALAKVVDFDPFAQPASLAEGSQPSGTGGNGAAAMSEKTDQNHAERERALATLRQEGVKMIVGTDKGFVAIVGSKTIHVGDQLDGFRVREIKPNGVVLEDK